MCKWDTITIVTNTIGIFSVGTGSCGTILLHFITSILKRIQTVVHVLEIQSPFSVEYCTCHLKIKHLLSKIKQITPAISKTHRTGAKWHMLDNLKYFYNQTCCKDHLF